MTRTELDEKFEYPDSKHENHILEMIKAISIGILFCLLVIMIVGFHEELGMFFKSLLKLIWL